MIYNSNQKETAIKFLSAILDKGKRIRIEQVIEKRSIDQNSLYWLWLTCIQQHTGNDKVYLHDYFRGKYLSGITIKIFGIEQFKLKSTTELNTYEFKQYLDKIQEFSNTELGIDLPNPEDLRFSEFQEHYKNFI
jgi:hypothetical protein